MPESALNLAGFNEDSAENILENRRRFLKLFPNDSGGWAMAGCWQMHGSDARIVDTFNDAKPAEDAHADTIYCDAIISDAVNVLAGVKTADCVPMLIGDAKSGAFAAVHAGWRGTLAQIAVKTLTRMSHAYAVNATDVVVALGPAARDCCYEVGTEVIEPFRERFPGQDLFKDTRPGHACINLLEANRDQLVASGVKSERIFTAPLCTMCHTELFFSYRQEKLKQGKVGRLMSVIGRRPTMDWGKG